jgi:hypothetical protein
LGLEAKKRLAGTIVAHDPHVKTRLVNFRNNRVSGHTAGILATAMRGGKWALVMASRDIGATTYNFDLCRPG